MTRREAARRRDLTDALASCAVILERMRCAGCGGSEVIAVEPGEAEDRTPLFLHRADVPTRAWCSSCWATSFERGMA